MNDEMERLLVAANVVMTKRREDMKVLNDCLMEKRARLEAMRFKNEMEQNNDGKDKMKPEVEAFVQEEKEKGEKLEIEAMGNEKALEEWQKVRRRIFDKCLTKTQVPFQLVEMSEKLEDKAHLFFADAAVQTVKNHFG